MNKNRLLTKILNNLNKVSVDSDSLENIATKGRSGTATLNATVYSSISNLPINSSSGDKAWVTSNNSLYISNGSGWYRVALINRSPYWITTPDSDYTLDLGNIDSDIIIFIEGGDSDGVTPTYTATLDSDANTMLTVTLDSEGSDGAFFAISRKDSDNSGTGEVTFKASDGNNFASFVSTFTVTPAVSFIPYGGDNLYYAGEVATLMSKFAMVSDSNAVTIPAISFAEHRYHYTGGGMSSTNGYIFGAKANSPYPSNYGNLIEKFPFAAEDAISNTGYTLAVSKGIGKNKEGIGNRTNIYTAAGGYPGILKFVTTSESNAASIGNHVPAVPAFFGGATGHSSETHGYLAGGHTQPATGSNVIQKFSFSSDGNATDVGDLTYNSWWGSGSSSTTHGYHAGGYKNPPSSPYPISTRNDIQKWPFSSDTNATDVGDLTYDAAHRSIGGSSPSNGYSLGNADNSNVIEKYSFSSDGNATDIANFGTNASYYVEGFGAQDSAS